MKTKSKMLLVLPLFIIGSCNSNYDRAESRSEVNSVSAIDTYSEENKVANTVEEEISDNLTLEGIRPTLKIIKNAEAKFLVSDVDSVTNQMLLLAKGYQGYVSDMKFNQNNYRIENAITITIPSAYFERFLTKSTKLAKHIDYNNITSKDVTEEFIDLENRIKVKEEVKARYEQILRSKAKSLNDVLQAERQIQLIQEEIESAKGRVKYINTKSAMSTIKLSLYEKVDYKEEPTVYNKSFGSKSKEGLKAGVYVLETIVIVLIYMWPLILGLAIGFFFLRRRLKKQKENK